MGNYVVEREATDWEQSGRSWQYNRRQGRLCPVCLDVISDRSTTCRKHAWEWREIKSSPIGLALWIVQAADVPELRGVKVWERDDQG